MILVDDSKFLQFATPAMPSAADDNFQLHSHCDCKSKRKL